MSSLPSGAMGLGPLSSVSASPSAAAIGAPASSASPGVVVSVEPDDTSRTWTMRPFNCVTIAVGISAPELCLGRSRVREG